MRNLWIASATLLMLGCQASSPVSSNNFEVPRHLSSNRSLGNLSTRTLADNRLSNQQTPAQSVSQPRVPSHSLQFASSSKSKPRRVASAGKRVQPKRIKRSQRKHHDSHVVQPTSQDPFQSQASLASVRSQRENDFSSPPYAESRCEQPARRVSDRLARVERQLDRVSELLDGNDPRQARSIQSRSVSLQRHAGQHLQSHQPLSQQELRDLAMQHSSMEQGYFSPVSSFQNMPSVPESWANESAESLPRWPFSR